MDIKRLTKMDKEKFKINKRVLDVIKKNMIIGIGAFKSFLPMIQDMDDDKINGKYKLRKSWLQRMYI
mgnify:CR=1 FL=1